MSSLETGAYAPGSWFARTGGSGPDHSLYLLFAEELTNMYSILNNLLQGLLRRPVGNVSEMLTFLLDFLSIRGPVRLSGRIYVDVKSGSVVHAKDRLHQMGQRMITVAFQMYVIIRRMLKYARPRT